MSASASEGDGPITAINVTPLVDIILVVLIIFMATAPLIQKRALKVDVPKAAHHERTATEAVAITCDAKRRLTVSGEAVSEAQLSAKLAAAAKGQPGLHVTLSADRTLSYGEIVSLLDLVRGAGVRKIGLEVSRK